MATTTYGTPYVQSSDLVSAYPGTSSTLATRVDDISLKGNGLNDQTGTTYTLVLTDGGKTITLNNASSVTVTIPTNTSVAFPLGTEINFVNKGAGTVTIQPTAGVTLNGGNLTLAQNAAVQVVKLETNTWGQLDSVASTPGLTLISPTSIANSGGSASASGGAVTFTGVTSISLNGVFSSTYEAYRIITQYTASASAVTNFRFRTSGTDNTASVYQLRIADIGAFTNGSTSDQNTAALITANTAGNGIVLDVQSPAQAQYTHCPYTSNSALVAVAMLSRFGVMAHLSTSTFDGFTIYQASGNITGTVRVYGYRN